VAVREGRLAEQEVVMQQRAELNAQREHDQLCQLEVMTCNFDAMRSNCAQQVRVPACVGRRSCKHL
jgi:hypothetical protein